jgi:hypothetical protein
MEIAVILNGSSGGIELTALMAASSMVAAFDVSSKNGIFTMAFHDDECILALNAFAIALPWTRIGRGDGGHVVMHHSLLPRLLWLAPSLSPLAGLRRQGQWPR